jgi:hypothetical protein
MCALRGYGALSCRDARLHQFGHGKHACLLHHAGSMLLRRVKGDFQFRGDLLVASSPAMTLSSFVSAEHLLIGCSAVVVL